MSGLGPGQRRRLVARLAAAGCLAAEEEADELAARAGGDGELLERLVARRTEGVPLAWLTGAVSFCGEHVLVTEGVYVPRWQSEPLAEEAARRLPERGVAVDLCTGAGAIALVLARRRPAARVLATDLDPAAVACARANGVEATCCDLASGLPPGLAGLVDVVTAVAPYVPSGELHLLPRDVRAHEPRLALDGGPDGLGVLRPAVAAAAALLGPGGSLLVELGGDQAALLEPVLSAAGLGEIVVARDRDGDVRAVYCRRPERLSAPPPR